MCEVIPTRGSAVLTFSVPMVVAEIGKELTSTEVAEAAEVVVVVVVAVAVATQEAIK